MVHQNQVKLSLGLFRFIKIALLNCAKYDHINRIRTFTSFNAMIENRKTQAKKTVVVEVEKKDGIVETLNICEKFGIIENAIHNTISQGYKRELLIVEYQENEMVKKLMKSCIFKQSEEVLPVQSRFLIHPGNLMSKTKSHNVKLTCNERPSFENIQKQLLECKNASEQMNILFETECLGDVETRLRFIACSQIEDALMGMFKYCKALPFGSSVNGFGRYNCDLDMYLDLHINEGDKNGSLHFQSKELDIQGRLKLQQTLNILGDLFHNFFPNISSVKRILHARVPILKFEHDLLKLECDLSMTNKSGIYMSELLYLFGKFDFRLQPLVFTIRKWAAIFEITNPFPGRTISNFALSLMAIFFLQNAETQILPSLQKLNVLTVLNDSKKKNGLDSAFRKEKKLKLFSNNSDLELLLIQFFEFYIKFDSKNSAISLIEGRPIIKPETHNQPFYIENPLERSLNVSKNVSQLEYNKLISEMETAIWRMRNSDLNWGILNLFHRNNDKKQIKNKKYLFQIDDIFEKDPKENKPTPSTKKKAIVKPSSPPSSKETEVVIDKTKPIVKDPTIVIDKTKPILKEPTIVISNKTTKPIVKEPPIVLPNKTTNPVVNIAKVKELNRIKFRLNSLFQQPKRFNNRGGKKNNPPEWDKW